MIALLSAEAVVIPHGIDDVRRNEGYITLGMSRGRSHKKTSGVEALFSA